MISCHIPSHSQSHMNENMEEVEMGMKLFPGHDSTAKIFDYHGLLTDKVYFMHYLRLYTQGMHTCTMCPVCELLLCTDHHGPLHPHEGSRGGTSQEEEHGDGALSQLQLQVGMGLPQRPHACEW